MLTVSSLLGVRNTLHMPSSSFSRMAASSKRAAAASHGFFSFSSDMETCGVNVATGHPSNNIVLWAHTTVTGSSWSHWFIHQFSRSRWRIDTEVFQTITTDCHLKYPAVHQTTALVVLTMIRFLAYTLSLLFYHRQVRSHARGICETFHEFAKRIARSEERRVG